MLFKMFPLRFIQLMLRLGEDGEGLSPLRDMSGVVMEQGRNCLVHCAVSTGRTGMVTAAIVQNLSCYDAVARIRMVKSTYVETKEQESLTDLARESLTVLAKKTCPV